MRKAMDIIKALSEAVRAVAESIRLLESHDPKGVDEVLPGELKGKKDQSDAKSKARRKFSDD